MSDSNKPNGAAIAGSLLELLRNSWFLIIFIGTIIYWAAKQDTSSTTVKKHEGLITGLESRVYMLEASFAQLQIKLDGIKEDITLIKTAVIK